MLKSAAAQWTDRDAPRLGAALAYYTLLSVAPLAVLTVAICGLAFDRNTAERDLLRNAQHLMGSAGAKTIKTLLDHTHQAHSGVVASGIALVTLLFGASSAFVELRNSLNTIWNAPATCFSLRAVVKQRLCSFAMVLALGCLLFLSLLLSTAFTVVSQFFSDIIPLHTAIWAEMANVTVTLAALAFLFALIFKFVPDVCIAWRDVVVGAIPTSILFTIGKALLALYLGRAAVGSTYGAAGTLIAFVVWLYYSAQILLFGAAFTHVYADTVGSRSRASKGSQSTPA
ncbi:MAG: YihY/virulence factor BrkB family protein [Acidobacteriaceae bacterium]|nr:YihY/virulence factor BrkB family protein [Acidobacteriaceae bacterium]